ncbi:uncharacterized protein LOC142881489 isoform X2 [Nelusetta ayraudi]|uniref:uncharacterized protein LOC142881489 isoform X1 n=1 Tax=Nelusetta ayraudi TaxID=303726 RepID=UPI003F704290
MKLLCVSILWTLLTAADANHTVEATTIMTPAQSDTTTRQPEWLFVTRLVALVALVASTVVIRLVWARIVSASKGSRGEEKHGKAAETEENRPSSRSHAPIRHTYIGRSPHSDDRTGRKPIGQNHVGQNPVGQRPIGQNHVGQNPVGQNPIWRNFARGCCYNDTSSIDTSRHIYDNDPV